jgi:hypothetical protein
MLKLSAEESIRGIVCRTQLLTETVRAEERYPGLGSIDSPAFPYQPTESSLCFCQALDFGVKGFRLGSRLRKAS